MRRSCWSIVQVEGGGGGHEAEAAPTALGKFDGAAIDRPIGDPRPTKELAVYLQTRKITADFKRETKRVRELRQRAGPLVAPLPADLRDDLQTEYSKQLYGAPGRLDLSRLRVLWPAALGESARASLAPSTTRCGVPLIDLEADSEPRAFLDWTLSFANAAALWVQQPPERWVDEPTPSSQWVEVSHCFYYSWGENVNGATPMWYFVAPGSGLSINVGRTLVVSESKYGRKQVGRLHKFLVNKVGLNTSRHSQHLQKDIELLLGKPIGEELSDERPLDTVQFILRSVPPSWGSERHSEIVVLGPWGKEMSYVHSWIHMTDRIQCGRHPWLRPCRLEDAAITSHGPSCAQPAPPKWLLEQTNCSNDGLSKLQKSFLEAKVNFAKREWREAVGSIARNLGLTKSAGV